jgi:hypothetical protein
MLSDNLLFVNIMFSDNMIYFFLIPGNFTNLSKSKESPCNNNSFKSWMFPSVNYFLKSNFINADILNTFLGIEKKLWYWAVTFMKLQLWAASMAQAHKL